MHRFFIGAAIFMAASLSSHADSKGLSFETIILPSSIQIPEAEPSANTPVLLALKITNTADKDILVNRYIAIIPYLRTSNHDVMETIYGQDGSYPPQANDFIFLRPNSTIYVLVDCSLSRASDGTLQFSGDTHPGGFWRIEKLPLKASKYFLSLVYWSEEREFPSAMAPSFYGKTPWYGKVETKPIPIELTN